MKFLNYFLKILVIMNNEKWPPTRTLFWKFWNRKLIIINFAGPKQLKVIYGTFLIWGFRYTVWSLACNMKSLLFHFTSYKHKPWQHSQSCHLVWTSIQFYLIPTHMQHVNSAWPFWWMCFAYPSRQTDLPGAQVGSSCVFGSLSWVCLWCPECADSRVFPCH